MKDGTMDICAALTLHVTRFVQMPVEAPASPLRWTFVPEGRRAGWHEAGDLLSNAPKPLMVAPLLEPGLLGTWGISALGGSDRARADHELSNQLAAFDDQASELELGDDSRILFETPADS